MCIRDRLCPVPVCPSPVYSAAVHPAPASPTPAVSPSRIMDNSSPPKTDLNVTARPRRVKFQRQMYDASSGQYSAPKAVSDDI